MRLVALGLGVALRVLVFGLVALRVFLAFFAMWSFLSCGPGSFQHKPDANVVPRPAVLGAVSQLV